MSELIASLLDPTRLLFDLQQANEIAQSFSGCLDPVSIARLTTDGLVERFGCAFVRIWLMEPDNTTLRLVASSGLYTRTDGSFARVPMGAYKVGKIAQNRVSFLSNNLAEESWVKDREWAIANHIRGFAGFPLTVGDRVMGVLATFSHDALAPEFLEVLQVLCTMASVAVETATLLHREQPGRSPFASMGLKQVALSDQLATILGATRLTLIGTEQPLPPSHTYLFLQVAEILNNLGCRYCRLLYQESFVVLEAITPADDAAWEDGAGWGRSPFGLLPFMASGLAGSLQSELIARQKVIQVLLKLPYPTASNSCLQIKCRLPLLQLALTHLAHAAGLQVWEGDRAEVPLLTDDPTHLPASRPVIWVQRGNIPVPQGVKAIIDLSITPQELVRALETVSQGNTWGMGIPGDTLTLLSDREREILGLLAEGLRDRDIAHQLIISESTVKFHVNNVLSKLKARTRFQALYQAMKKGWL